MKKWKKVKLTSSNNMNKFFAVHAFPVEHAYNSSTDNVINTKIKFIGRIVADNDQEAERLLIQNIKQKRYPKTAFIVPEADFIYG